MIQGEEKQVVVADHHFTCQDCIFVQKNILGRQSTSNPCKLHRIQKYEKDGFKIIKEKYFKVLGLMGCTSKRNVSWEYSTDPFENQVEKIKEAHQIQYDIIFYWPVCMQHVIEKYIKTDLESKLKKLYQLNIQPKKIIVAFEKNPCVSPSEIAQILDKTKIPYGISTMEPGQNQGDLINLAYDLTESPYMWVVPIDDDVLNIPNAINNIITKFDRILLSYDKDHRAEEIFTSTILFDKLKGCDSLDTSEPNTITRYIDKVKVLVNDQNKQSLIKRSEDITNEWYN